MVQAGDEVRVVLTAGGTHFVQPLTFAALTGNPTAVEVWDEQSGSSRMGHLDLADWADLLVIAPATAGVLARLALGLTDDMLGALALACRAPLLIAPAMESRMWLHPATQQHVRTLTERGAIFAGPGSGWLASGTQGEGRMAEPAAILSEVHRILSQSRDLEGRHVLVTAGPTLERIDPVRFLGNRSSGKMGFALAEEARDRGAQVLLITGPVALPDPPGVQVTHIESATELRESVLTAAPDQDVIVMAAAVADFRPESTSSTKIKRARAASIRLTPTEDIAAEAKHVAPQAFHVSFALESKNLIRAAQAKRARKGSDLVVANLISAEHNPFGHDTNRVAFVTEDRVTELPEMPKREVARLLWDEIARRLSGLTSEQKPEPS